MSEEQKQGTVGEPVIVRDAEIVPEHSAAETTHEPVAAEHPAVEGDVAVASDGTIAEGSAKRRLILSIGAAVLIALLAYGGLMIFGRSELAQKLAPSADKPIAVVNGESITRGEYDTQVAFVTQNASAQFDTTNPEIITAIKEQALDMLIKTRLLIQAAKESDFTATQEAVDAQYNLLVSQFGTEEALLAQISAVGLTTEKVRTNIANEILISTYLQNRVTGTTFEASDAEINDLYTRIFNGAADAPKLAEVKEDLAAQISNTKQQEKLDEIITGLKDAAQIEIFLEG